MVADSNDHYTLSFRGVIISRFIVGVCPVYLFAVLIMKISKEQQSVIAIVAALLLIAWLKHNVYWVIAALVVALTIFSPVITGYIHKLWMGIAKILGIISSHIILFILFYLVLTPIALIKRWSSGNNSMVKFDKNQTSGFVIRNHLYKATDFLNPW